MRGFYNDRLGKPYQLTKGQSEIFGAVYDPNITRAVIKATTRYGKSDVTALAILHIAITSSEKILIVAPSEKQARIIMGYVIQHIFDNPLIKAKLDYVGDKEKLRKEQSKTRITFNTGAEIFLLTAETKTVSREAKNLMGFGATIVVIDESSLIPDPMYSKIFRMVGEVKDGKLVQLGNPFERNHFKRAFDSHRYKKISIDWHQSVAEGRLTKEFVEEAKEESTPMDFQIFYDCEFPTGGAEDSLIPYDWIKKAVGRNIKGDEVQVGIDIARFGRDKSIYLLRKGYTVSRIDENSKIDTMSLVGWIRNLLDNDDPDVIAIDVIGIGAGVCDRLDELGYEVSEVNVGSSADDKDKFYNLRTEVFWHLRDLFKKDKIGIPNDAGLIQELTDLRYKYSSEKKLRLEAKADMKKRIGRSPDKADALALAYHDAGEYEPAMIIM